MGGCPGRYQQGAPPYIHQKSYINYTQARLTLKHNTLSMWLEHQDQGASQSQGGKQKTKKRALQNRVIL